MKNLYSDICHLNWSDVDYGTANHQRGDKDEQPSNGTALSQNTRATLSAGAGAGISLCSQSGSSGTGGSPGLLAGYPRPVAARSMSSESLKSSMVTAPIFRGHAQ
jgi:hypothetical protein